jgi:hypothetical protein
VYTALLLGQPVAALVTCEAGTTEAGASREHAANGPDDRAASPADGDSPAQPESPNLAGFAGESAPGPALTGSVNLTMPLATWLGGSTAPGDVAGFGPIPGDDARALAALVARQPGSRWCLTLTSRDGRAIGHGCARAGPPPAGGDGPGRATPGGPGRPGPETANRPERPCTWRTAGRLGADRSLSSGRSRPADAPTNGNPPDIGQPRRCLTSSTSASGRAGFPAAAILRRAATRTTRSRMTRAAERANATWRACADGITAPNKLKAGSLTSPNQAFSSGDSRTGAATGWSQPAIPQRRMADHEAATVSCRAWTDGYCVRNAAP